jgi:protein-S-isoprenylcysteine O-methyltransferase Ste14
LNVVESILPVNTFTSRAKDYIISQSTPEGGSLSLLDIIRPEFSPSLLCLLCTLPGFLGNRTKRYNGAEEYESGESVAAEMTMGCLAVFVHLGAYAVLAYSLFPRYFQFAQVFQQRPGLMIAGMAVAVAGIGLACWARVVLAGNWVGGPYLRSEHQLVTAGPYRRIRHPIYSGFAVFHIGVLVATGNVLPLVSDGIFRAMLLRQALAEERLLIGRFGETYLEYRRRTGRFLPKLRKG